MGTVGHAFRLSSGKVLPALDDYVAIEGVNFQKESVPASLLGPDESGAAAGEEIENVFATARGVLNRADGQVCRFFRQVDHVLRVDLVDGPDVGDVVRAEE